MGLCQTLLLPAGLDGLCLAAKLLQVPRLVVIFVLRFILGGPLAALEQSTTCVVLGLAGLLLGGLLVQAVLLPLGEALGRDGCEVAGELVAFRFEEVFECEGLEWRLVQEGLFGGSLFLGLKDEATDLLAKCNRIS